MHIQSQMKITVGLGSIDDYIPYVEAGADECFIGYIPATWQHTWGSHMPLNRREVMYYNVQIGSDSELEILREMVDVYGVPVRIVINSLYYRPDQYYEILDIIRHCISLGYTSYIIADLGLLFYLETNGISEKIDLCMSGEFAEINTEVLKFLADHHVNRLIFHRKMSIIDQTYVVQSFKNQYPHIKLPVFEAFMLNECCRFHGAFCQSLHCDELAHICHLPYQLQDISAIEESKKNIITSSSSHTHPDSNLVGLTGCGLCALPYLQCNGVRFLKVVGRGNYSEDMIRDIKVLRQSLMILDQNPDPLEYIKEMKRTIFPYGCTRNCYYSMPE